MNYIEVKDTVLKHIKKGRDLQYYYYKPSVLKSTCPAIKAFIDPCERCAMHLKSTGCISCNIPTEVEHQAITLLLEEHPELAI